MGTEKKETLRSLFREIYAPIMEPRGFVYRKRSFVKMNREKGYVMGIQADKYRGSSDPNLTDLEIFVDFLPLIARSMIEDSVRALMPVYGDKDTFYLSPLSYRSLIDKQDLAWALSRMEERNGQCIYHIVEMPLRERIEASAETVRKWVVPCFRKVHDIDSLIEQEKKIMQSPKALLDFPSRAWYYIYKHDYNAALKEIEQERRKEHDYLRIIKGYLTTHRDIFTQDDYDRKKVEVEKELKQLDELQEQLQQADDAWAEREIRKNIDENCRWLKLDFESKQKEAQ